MNPEPPLTTRPPTKGEQILQAKFYEHLVAQSDLMDKIAAQLLTVELAVPGLYAAVLKLVQGDKATVPLNAPAVIAFALWLLALLLTLVSLFPRKWRVDTGLLRQAPGKMDEALGIEDFFHHTAAHKRNLLLAASVCFFFGIFAALFI